MLIPFKLLEDHYWVNEHECMKLWCVPATAYSDVWLSFNNVVLAKDQGGN